MSIDDRLARKEAKASGATGEGLDSPVRGVRQCPEFEFWPAASGITGEPKPSPLPPNRKAAG